MKKYILIFLLALTGFCYADEISKNAYTLSKAQIYNFDNYLSKITKAYHIPGMAFLITGPDSALYGYTSGQCKSMDQQFFIGSMSKSYTALCIMQLVEKGKINLDDDFTLYLPEYKFEKKITVLNLLNHTSGFDTHMKLYDKKHLKITETYGKYEYANVNYDLLGKIIEKVSGKSYKEYIKENIFTPLGMDSSFGDALSVKNSNQLLKGNRNYFGFFIRGEADYPTEKSWFHEPAGYIASTPADHGKYLRMYLNGGLTPDGKEIITKESINSMWYKNIPLCDSYNTLYGMGWNFMYYGGQPIIFHGGLVENGITYMFILPKKNIAVCFMINGADEFGMNNLMDSAFWSSLKILDGEKPDEVNFSDYRKIHLLYDLIYFIIFAVSVLGFVLAIRSKNGFNSNHKIRKIILGVIGFLFWPLLLLTFSKIFIDTPLWVIKSFVPDLFLTIVISVILSFAGGIIMIIKSKRGNYEKISG